MIVLLALFLSVFIAALFSRPASFVDGRAVRLAATTAAAALLLLHRLA